MDLQKKKNDTDTMTTFYIVRHGETDWNVQKRIQGQTDIPLNENGKLQAKNLASELKNITFDLAFSSDLLRAKETAEIIALEHALEVETTKILRERMFGKYEGTDSAGLRAFDKLFDALSDNEKYTFKEAPDIESDEELMNRLIPFLRETAITHPNKTILMVSHGGVIKTLLIHLGYLTYKEADQRFLTNSGFIKITSDGTEFQIDEVKGLKESDW